jgi:peptidoglycan/LPS O-acetylase OafA/YrhL
MIYIYKYNSVVLDIMLCLIFFISGYFITLYFSEPGSFLFVFAYYSGYIMISKLIFENYATLKKIDPMIYVFSLMIVIPVILYQIFLSSSIWQMFGSNILFSILVFMFFTFKTFKENKIITLLSEYSFGIYLVHFLFYQFSYLILTYLKVEINFMITFLNILITYVISFFFCFILSKNKFFNKVI